MNDSQIPLVLTFENRSGFQKAELIIFSSQRFDTYSPSSMEFRDSLNRDLETRHTHTLFYIKVYASVGASACVSYEYE